MCVLCLLLACALAAPALLAQERPTGVLDLSEAEKAQVLSGFLEWTPPGGATRAELPDKVMNLAHLGSSRFYENGMFQSRNVQYGYWQGCSGVSPYCVNVLRQGAVAA
jgi:hypothetical protein